MTTTLIKFPRWLACFFLLNLSLAQAALAAPATRESLQKYFEVTQVSALSSRAITAISAMQAQEWQNEKDPVEQAKKKEVWEKMDVVISKNLSWDLLEPMALDSYKDMLQEEEVQAMIAYGESPAGRLHFGKLTPTLVDGLPKIMAYMTARAEGLGEMKEGDSLKPGMKAPAPGSKEAPAYAMLHAMPGAYEEFTRRMDMMETNMLKSAEMFSDDKNSEIHVMFKRMATIMKRDISYDEITALKATIVVDKLSEAEIAILAAEFQRPALKAMLAKQAIADRTFGEQAEKHMREKLMPVLMKEISSIVGAETKEDDEAEADAEPAAPAKAPAKATAKKKARKK